MGGWVSVSPSILYLYSVSPLYLSVSPLTSLSFFFFFSFCFLRFLLSPFGFVLLRVRVEFFFSFKIYMGHGLLGWLDDGLHDFWEGGRAKNSGAQALFFLILLTKNFFFWARAPLALYLDPSLLVKDI